MKKLILFLFALIMVLTLVGCNGKTDLGPSGGGTNEPSKPEQGGNDDNKETLVSKVGDTASFGTYNNKPIVWLCIAVQGEKALLITKDCITLDVFDDLRDDTEAVWADCTLRAWLNGEFLNSLSTDEQAIIIDTEHNSNENFNYADYPEEEIVWKNCTDKVFLLSADEITTYFTDDESRIAKFVMTDDEKDVLINRYETVLSLEEGTGVDYLNEFMSNDGVVDYWLRSHGRGYMAQTVSIDGEFDDYTAYGSIQDSFFGVRPAVWVNISSNGNK